MLERERDLEGSEAGGRKAGRWWGGCCSQPPAYHCLNSKTLALKEERGGHYDRVALPQAYYEQA